MDLGNQAKTIQDVYEALKKVVDPDGMCLQQSASARVSALTGLTVETVVKHFRALRSLGVIEVVKRRSPHSPFGGMHSAENRIRLLRPDVVIVKRNGFFKVEESSASG